MLYVNDELLFKMPTKKAPVVFESVSHPTLETLDPADAVRFIRERELYEAELAERAATEGHEIAPASYRISLDPIFLRSVYAMGCFDPIAPETSVNNLSEAHIKTFIASIAKSAAEEEPNGAMIESALKGLRTKMSIRNPRARIFQLALEFDTRMADNGYESFREKNPKKAIELLVGSLHPAALKEQIKSDLEYKPTIKKDWKAFLMHAAKMAEHIQLGQDSAARVGSAQDKKEPRKAKHGKVQNDPQVPGHHKAGEKGNRSGASTSAQTDQKRPPKCLNEACSEYHLVRDCKMTSAELAKKLVQQQREKKQADMRAAKAVRSNSSPDVPEGSHVTRAQMNSTLFRACFAQVSECIVCADIGSDINLLPPTLLNELQDSGAKMTVVKFAKVRAYGLAVTENADGNVAQIICDRQVTLDVQLFIRHGASLWLRNITWYVATKDVPEPLLGRPVLQALGLDAQETMQAASALHDGSVDVEQLLRAPDELPRGSVARVISEQGLYHHSGAMVDAEHDPTPTSELGVEKKEEVDEAFDKLIKEAVDNGCENPDGLRHLLEKHRDVFRCKLGPDPPALVEPMDVQIVPNCKPVMAKPRHYSTEQRKVIADFMRQAVEYGFMRENKNASWASPPLLIPKPKQEKGQKNYRVAFDLRAVNAVTIPQAWPLPHIDSELADFREKKCFAVIDFPSSYWQVPNGSELQELHSVITPVGIYSPTRTLQGGRNSAANFQSRVEPCFADIRDNLKAWLDDFILHARDCEELLHVLDRFFTICAEKRLKVSAKKSTLFAASVKWCGRIIDKNGMRMDPRHIEGISTMENPQTAEELSQFVHCAQWMGHNIPDFAARVQPLRNILELAYEKVGRRTSKAISKVKLSDIAWGNVESAAMRSIQDSLRNTVTLAHFNQKMSVCVYTDASDAHWAAVVTQCDPEELLKDQDEQKHEPLAFLGSEFKGPSRNWSTIEKEGFAIFSTFKTMDYLLMGSDDNHVYTDHRNLLYVFHPTAIEPGLGRHIVSKLQRWALFLSQFPYHIEHVRGEKNVMADMMTRWFAGYRGKREVCMARRVVTRSRAAAETRTDGANMDPESGWPSILEIKTVQDEYLQDRPRNARLNRGIYVVNGRAWIPENAHELHIRVLAMAHCGKSGHRGADATASIARERYTWSSLKEDCSEFVNDCLVCLTASSGEKIPRPLAATLHGERPNGVVHFDYLYMGPSTDGAQYVLLLKDDFSSYCWLVTCTHARADEAAKAISAWIRNFTVMSTWVSDQGAHFKNVVLKSLAEDYGINHHFTIAYSPWANGTVERLCREVLRTTRALLAERKWAEEDWPAVVSTVQSALNEAPVRRLGTRSDGTYRTPLEVMTGIRPNRATPSPTAHCSALSSEARKTLIESLQESLEHMHRDVKTRTDKERHRARAQHNKKTNVRPVNIAIGDFVMVRRATRGPHKLSYKWVGPRRVVDAHGNSAFEVEALITKARATVHVTRLRLVCTAEDGTDASYIDMAAHTESIYETVEEILGTELRDGELYAHIKWSSPEDKEDCTWQKFSEMLEDIPDMIKEYVKTSQDHYAAEALGAYMVANDQAVFV